MRILRIRNRIIVHAVLLLVVSFQTCCTYIRPNKLHPLTFIYPRQAYVGETYIGKIAIELDYDTIPLKPKDLRGTLFYYGIFNRNYSIEELEGIPEVLDTAGFSGGNMDTIYFDYQFDEPGNFYLEGYIKDILVVHRGDDEKARLLTKQIKISSHKINVKNRVEQIK